MKPAQFVRRFVVMQDVAYSVVEPDSVGAIPKVGMLPVGKDIFVPEVEQQLGEAKIMAFAEGVGTIAVSRNSIASIPQRGESPQTGTSVR